MVQLPALRPDDPAAQIAVLAQRYRRANGPVIAIITRLGGRIEEQFGALPDGIRKRIEAATTSALQAANGLAARGDALPDLGQGGHLAAAMAAGAAGGAGGLSTAVAELPVTVTLILHAIRAEARGAGYDPDLPAIRAECLRVFAAGSPLASDDGINTAFLSARVTLSGPAVQKIIATVAPRLASALGQKLAAQTVPLLGAVTGAALNVAFLNYYREVARIRFALMRLAEAHGAEQVLAEFTRLAEPPRVTRA